MTSQVKQVSSSVKGGGGGGGRGKGNTSRKTTVPKNTDGAGVAAGGGAGGGAGGEPGATKNTRRRVHQKRTRNKVPRDGKPGPAGPAPVSAPVPIVSVKPVLESTNPFFIAVCAPDSYKPSYAGVCAGGGGGGECS